MQPLLNIAIRAARRAGEIIVRGLNRLHRLEVRAKGQNDFVSEIDTQAERDIIETVRRHYPQHSFLAEESGRSGEDNMLSTSAACSSPSVGSCTATRTVGAASRRSCTSP